MSAHALRELVRHRAHIELHGDGQERGGVCGTINAGLPKDYPTYRDLCGYVRGINAVLKMMDDGYQEMHEPAPAQEQK